MAEKIPGINAVISGSLLAGKLSVSTNYYCSLILSTLLAADCQEQMGVLGEDDHWKPAVSFPSDSPGFFCSPRTASVSPPRLSDISPPLS